jgi:nucleoside-diphosphate-sugar epimerase
MEGISVSDSGRTVLVTGASGFIGARVVSALLTVDCGQVRCFVRPTSRLEALRTVIAQHGAADRVEIVAGDLTSPQDCRRAVEGVGIVLHLAAGFDKSFAGAFMNSAVCTRNLIEAFLEGGSGGRFVNVSSFAVYSAKSLSRHAVLDEAAPLEDAPQERYDAYAFGKLEQERIVREYGRSRDLKFVVLRPGMVFGPGKRDLSGRVAIDTFGFFVQVGGRNCLPMTFVDNCADAIVSAGFAPGIEGETFNVVDDELLTGRQFLERYRKAVPRFFVLWMPYWAAYAFCCAWERYARASHGQLPPAFNRRRCAAEWKPLRYSNERIRRRLGWSPRVGSDEAMKRFMEQFAA